MSGTEVLHKKLPNVKALHILPNCEHLVFIDALDRLSEILNEFHIRI